MNIGKATELSVLEYAASLDLNPENLFYQRVRSNSASPSNVQWSIITPDVRSLLLSYAQIDWSFTLQHADDAAADLAITSSNGIQTSFKPIMPFTNAMTSQTVSINGNSITMSQPRNFIENLSRLNVSKSESASCYENQWWDDSGGNFGAMRQAYPQFSSSLDKGLDQNERLFTQKLIETRAASAAPTLVGNAGASVFQLIRLQEPLLCAPFNPYAKVQSGMPDYMPMKWMSPVIPNIKQLQVSCQMNSAKLVPGIMFNRYSLTAVRNQWILSNLQADLLLYWYQVPTTMSIPRAPMLQTWNMTEYQNPVGGAPIADGAEGPVVNNSPLIQLESVPGFILIHARRRQDDTDYKGLSMSSDTDGFGTAPLGSYLADGAVNDNPEHSLDTYLEIRNMRVQLGSRPDAISTDFSQRQLYDVTLKNAKYNGFSLNFQSWKSQIVNYIRYDTGVDNDPNPANSLLLLAQMSKSFVCLQPKDLAQQISPGVRFPNSLLVQIGVRGRDGACGMKGGTHTYDLFVHVFVNKHWIRIEPDRAQYEEQSVTLPAATQMLQNNGDLAGLGDGAYTAKF
jgi:hypothetical protein